MALSICRDDRVPNLEKTLWRTCQLTFMGDRKCLRIRALRQKKQVRMVKIRVKVGQGVAK